jgi:hypothetical protein
VHIFTINLLMASRLQSSPRRSGHMRLRLRAAYHQYGDQSPIFQFWLLHAFTYRLLMAVSEYQNAKE